MIVKNVIDKLVETSHDEIRKLFYDLRKEVMELQHMKETLIPTRSYRDFFPTYLVKRKELFRILSFSPDAFLVRAEITNKLEHHLTGEGIVEHFLTFIQDSESKQGIKIVDFLITNKKEVTSFCRIMYLKHRLYLDY